MTIAIGFAAHAADEVLYQEATPENLATFELAKPQLTEQEKRDLEYNEKLEADQVAQEAIFNKAPELPSSVMESTSGARISLELYQNAPSIGKQFLLAREDGRIRYVFAVSAAASGHSTPTGYFGVIKQLWRHMSATYPSSGENNMDHVTYFKPMYGFHSTTFGAYSVLGTRASHGCVRLARPQARAIFSLVRANGSMARVTSYGRQDPNPGEMNLIKKLLANDLNFIQDMIRSRNKGDVPFKEEGYYNYLAGVISERDAQIMAQNAGIPKILEVDGGQGRIPRSSPAALLQ